MNLKPLNSALSFLHRNTHRINEKESLSAGFRAKSGHTNGISKKTENKLQGILTRTLGCTSAIAPKINNIRNTYDELSICTSIVMQMPQNQARGSMRNLLLMFIAQTNDANFHWHWEDTKLQEKFEELNARLAKLEPTITNVPASGRPLNFSVEHAKNVTARLEAAGHLHGVARQSSEEGSLDDSIFWDDGDCTEPDASSTSDDADSVINATTLTPPPSYTSIMRAGQSHKRAGGTLLLPAKQ